MVHGTSFASKIGKWWPAITEVRPKTSFEIGQVSMAIFFSLKISMSRGCLAIAYPCPIRLELRRTASNRLPSTLSPTSSVSPQWKRKGISNLCALHFFRNSRNSGTKSRSSLPISSWPTRSKPVVSWATIIKLSWCTGTYHRADLYTSFSDLYTHLVQLLFALSRRSVECNRWPSSLQSIRPSSGADP